MRWVLNNTFNQSHFWSLQEHDRKAELRYNKEAHSMRLNTPDRRLFFLERTGLRQQRILLKTEYSVVIGESHFRDSNSGTLIIDGEKFSFLTKEGLVSLFNNNRQLVAETTIESPEHLDLYEFSALLFGLEKANRMEMAVA
jgi:hypothetical protein